MNIKYAHQKLCGLHASPKSVAGSSVGEFKSTFLSMGKQYEGAIKFTTASCMMGKSVTAEEYHYTASSHAQQIISNGGSWLQTVPGMLQSCFRRNALMQVLPGGKNRLFDDCKQLMMPPALGGFPYVGPAALYTATADLAAWKHVIDNNDGIGEVVARILRTKRDETRIPSTLDDSYGFRCKKPRSQTERNQMNKLAEVHQREDSDNTWLRNTVLMELCPELKTGGRLRCEQGLVSHMEAGYSGANKVIVTKKTQILYDGTFFYDPNAVDKE